MTIADRLMRKANETASGCHEWLGYTRNGYGRMTTGSRTDGTRKTESVHRVAYREWVGPIGDALVLHNCDNRKCINPKHLYLGDHRQNVQDAIDRHRFSPQMNVDNSNAKITELTARRIKWLRSRDVKCNSIAEGLDVSLSIVKEISCGRTWSHIPEPPESK